MFLGGCNYSWQLRISGELKMEDVMEPDEAVSNHQDFRRSRATGQLSRSSWVGSFFLPEFHFTFLRPPLHFPFPLATLDLQIVLQNTKVYMKVVSKNFLLEDYPATVLSKLVYPLSTVHHSQRRNFFAHCKKAVVFILSLSLPETLFLILFLRFIDTLGLSGYTHVIAACKLEMCISRFYKMRLIAYYWELVVFTFFKIKESWKENITVSICNVCLRRDVIPGLSFRIHFVAHSCSWRSSA